MDGVSPGAPDGRSEDRPPAGRHGKKAVRREEPVAPGRIPGEPLLERRADSSELGSAAGDCDHRAPERSVDRVEVDDVEPAENRTIEQHRPDAVERTGRADDRHDASRGVAAVHAHSVGSNRLDLFGHRNHDGRDGRDTVPPDKSAVVHPDHARVDLGERAPQGYDPGRGRSSAMSSTTLTVRCPTCGEELRAVLLPSPPTQWFPCPHCRSPVPVVVPRDPPPLYTWEVLPNLYPPLPRPHIPRWQPRRVAAATLIGVMVLAGTFGALLSYYGVAATAPGSYPVSGTVERALPGGGTALAEGATVTLTEEGGGTRSETTGFNGSFWFEGVPTGGIAVSVSLSGYAPLTVNTFASSVYDAGTTGILVILESGSAANSTTVSLSPFTDLESLLASIGSGVVLLGLVALVAGGAAVVTFRRDRPTVGVIGGGAGVLAPLALSLLALSIAFPVLILASWTLALVGGFVLALRAAELAGTGPAEGPD